MLKRLFIITVILLAISYNSIAQCNIIDAYTNFDSTKATIFLTDTNGLIGIRVQMDANQDSLNAYNTYFSTGGSNISIQPSGEIDLSLGTLPTLSHYYIRYTVVLSNNTGHSIQLEK